MEAGRSVEGPPSGSPAGWYALPQAPQREGYWTGEGWSGSTRRCSPRRERPVWHPGLRAGILLHAGDGNLHPHILFDADDETQRQAAFEVSQEILRACLRLGGTISGEHGIGLEKISMMSEVYAPADLQTMGRLRRAFDPGGLLNPGKMLPEVRPA